MKGYDNDQLAMIRHINTILWHMRGGITREDAWTLSPTERKEIVAYIEERMKIVEDTKLPLL